MRGLYHATSSMLVNQVHLEHISNNLANSSTPGYKRSKVTYKTFPEILLCRTERIGNGKTTLAGPIGVSSGSIATDETVIIQQPGALLLTERELDLALQGVGFFAVDTPNGIRYTRDGNFILNSEGLLVTPRGFPVMGEDGPIYLSTEKPYFDREGNIFVDGKQVDRIQVYIFAEDDELQRDGYNLFRVEGGANPVPAGAPLIFQGYLEESNVGFAEQMVELIKVRRSYEAAQKVSQVCDRLLTRSANELGALR
ncbi:MAG: flagellar hook-basal body protein [Dethiobacteria bacterium]|jgi:flagellar basal-body rod protein FlgF